MTELNKENREWFTRHDRNYIAASGRVIHSSDVEQKLLEMQQRIDELKSECFADSVTAVEFQEKPDLTEKSITLSGSELSIRDNEMMARGVGMAMNVVGNHVGLTQLLTKLRKGEV